MEFSREYGHRARDLQRTGPLPGVLPTIAECDDMIRNQQRIQDLLNRLREMIVTEQHSVAATRHVQERTYKGAEFEMEEPASSVDDGKPNGILAADARKRRGVRFFFVLFSSSVDVPILRVSNCSLLPLY